MARNDVRIHDVGGLNVVPTYQWSTAAATTLVSGDAATNTNGSTEDVIRVVDNTPTTGDPLAGVVALDSTDTASAAGVVQLYIPVPGVVYECKAETAANVDTAAEITALVGNSTDLLIDTGTTIVVDEDGATNTKGILIVGGDPNLKTVWFLVKPTHTIINAVA